MFPIDFYVVRKLLFVEWVGDTKDLNLEPNVIRASYCCPGLPMNYGTVFGNNFQVGYNLCVDKAVFRIVLIYRYTIRVAVCFK